MRGWIRLDRRIMDMEGYFGEKFTRTQALIDLMLTAQWEERRVFRYRGEKVTVSRGQTATSTRLLAERWKRDKKTVTSWLSGFEEDGYITVERSNLITVITVNNYAEAQDYPTDWTTENGGEYVDDEAVGLEENEQTGPQIGPQTGPQTGPHLKKYNNIVDDEDKRARVRAREEARGINERFFKRYFHPDKAASIESLLMQLKKENPATRHVEHFRSLAIQVINEWEQNEEPPIRSYTEWSKRLISQIRIKNRRQHESNTNNRKCDQDEARERRADEYSQLMRELLDHPDG